VVYNLPGFAVGNLELGTKSCDEHVVVDDELGDGGWRQGDCYTDHPEQRRQLLHRRRRERHLRPQMSDDLNDLSINTHIQHL